MSKGSWREVGCRKERRMNEAENALIARTILKAEVDGHAIRLVMDNGTTFYYEASDGGYSSWKIIKEKEKRE